MAIHTTVFKNARTVTCVIAKNKWGCVEKKTQLTNSVPLKKSP